MLTEVVINLLSMKYNIFDLKVQIVPRSKYPSSRLQKPVS